MSFSPSHQRRRQKELRVKHREDTASGGSTPRSKPEQSRSNYLDEIVTRKKAVIWHILLSYMSKFHGERK
jgi:hypothetical protein